MVEKHFDYLVAALNRWNPEECECGPDIHIRVGKAQEALKKELLGPKAHFRVDRLNKKLSDAEEQLKKL